MSTVSVIATNGIKNGSGRTASQVNYGSSPVKYIKVVDSYGNGHVVFDRHTYTFDMPTNTVSCSGIAQTVYHPEYTASHKDGLGVDMGYSISGTSNVSVSENPSSTARLLGPYTLTQLVSNISHDWYIQQAGSKIVSYIAFDALSYTVNPESQKATRVYAYYTDGTSAEVTQAGCTYRSADTSVVEIASNGVVTGHNSSTKFQVSAFVFATYKGFECQATVVVNKRLGIL